MATSDVQNNAIAVPADAPVHTQAGAERAYPMSRRGRRQAILLLLGVASIWIFALWTLITILQEGVGGVKWVSLLLMIAILAVAPVVAWTLLEEANSRIVTSADGIRYETIGGVNLSYKWEELQGFKGKEGRGRIARFFLGDDDESDNSTANRAEAGESRPGGNDTTGEKSEANVAATEQAVGARLIAPLRSETLAPGYIDGIVDEEEPETLLLRVRDNHADRIANPLIRFLHSQAHGPYLPIYGGLENRRQLLDEIANHARRDLTPPRT